MNILAYELGKPDSYSMEYGVDGNPIPATHGEGLPFINADGHACHSGKGSRDENGKRKIVLQITSWVGTSVTGAVHYYAKLLTGGVSGYTRDDTGEPTHSMGRGDECKPKAMKPITIRIDRPATERDVDHWVSQHGANNKNREWQCPRPGEAANGFWERGEALVAGKAVYDRWFGDANGWVLYVDDPDLESDYSEVPWTDDILTTIPEAVAKTRHDVDWKSKWVDPYVATEASEPLDVLSAPLGTDPLLSVADKTKCRHCRKLKGDHKAGDFACPIGAFNRTFGYTHYHANQFFA